MRAFSLLRPAFAASLSSGPDLSDWQFYIDFNQQAGPTRLANELPGITINGIEEQPIILLLGQDATTASWPNRGSLGGSLTAVNIRAEDLDWSTPYTDGTRSVYFRSTGGGTRRYYEAADGTFGDINTEDFIIEYILEQDATASGFDAQAIIKRNWSSTANDGFGIYSTSATGQTFALGTAASTAVRTATITKSARSWLYGIAYVDNNIGGAHLIGSHSAVTVASLALSSTITNTVPLRVGDSTVPGIYTNPSNVGFRLAYLAVWRRQNWFAGGTVAANNATLQQQIRIRQQYLGGIVPTKNGLTPTVITCGAPRYTTTINNSNEHEMHFCNPGCISPDQFIVPNTGEVLSGQLFKSAVSGVPTAETFSGWTTTNVTSATNTTISIPQSNTAGSSSTGVTLTGTAGSGERSISFLTTAASTSRRSYYQVYVCPGGAPFFYIGALDTVGGSNRNAWVNLSTGAVTLDSGSNLICRVKKMINGWWNVYFAFTNGSSSSDITARLGFSDTASSFTCTTDGSTATGHLWGWFATSSISFADDVDWGYSSTIANANPGYQLQWQQDLTTPLSLWFEIVSPVSIDTYATTAYPITVGPDSSNLMWYQHTTNNNDLEFTQRGDTAAATAWSITTPVLTGENSTQSGKRTRFAQSIKTDNIRTWAKDGTSLGTDTTATLPSMTASYINVGSSSAGAVTGYNNYMTRVGIAAVPVDNANGPPGTGVE